MKLRFSLLLLILGMLMSGQINAQINLNLGLEACYPFTGNAIDSTLNGYNGVVGGPVLTTDRHGNPNQAYLFDGINDYIDIPGGVNPNRDEWAVSFWSKTNTFSGNFAFCLVPDSWTDRLAVHVNHNHNGDTAMIFDHGNAGNGGRLAYVPAPWMNWGWEHLVYQVSVPLDSMWIYRDNQLVLAGKHSSSIVNNTRTLRIGGRLSVNFFSGILDDIKIWSRSLTRAEITYLYNEQRCQCSYPVICLDTASFLPSALQACGNDSITLTNTSQGGGPYQWFDNGVPFSSATNPKWASGVNGSHTIRLVAGVANCADTFDLTLTQRPGLTADAGNGPIWICPNDTTQIGGSPSAIGGSGPINYAWTPSPTLDNPLVPNPNAFPGSNTLYVLSLLDSVGCEAFDSIQVVVTTNPIADAGGPFTICAEDSIAIGGSPTSSGGTGNLSMLWSPSGNISSTTVSNPTVWPGGSQFYTVVVTDSLGCTSIDSAAVIVNPLPVIDTSLMQISWGTCDSLNGSIVGVTATGTPTLNYLWTKGALPIGSSPTITGLDSGYYHLTVTDGNNCTADMGPVYVGQHGSLFPVVITTGVAMCDSLNGWISTSTAGGGVPPYQYQWSDGSSVIGTSLLITGLDSGWYYLTVTDTNGCRLDTSGYVSRIPLPPLAANFDSTHTWFDQPVSMDIGSNDTGNVAGITIIIPPLNGTATVDNLGNMFYTPNPGYTGYDYFYYIICDSACVHHCDTAQVLIHVKPQIPLFVPTGFSPNEDGINDKFHIIGLSFYPENSITIFNRWGDRIFEANPYNNDWEGHNVKSNKTVTDGTYYYILTLTPGGELLKGPIEIRR